MPIFLGSLERQIMDVVWQSDKCSVWDVVKKLRRKRAYTTVMTTLTRLYQKKIVNRNRVGGKFLYSARLSRQELEESIAQRLITTVLARSTASRELIVSSLLEAIRRQELALFDDKVATMMRAKKCRLV